MSDPTGLPYTSAYMTATNTNRNARGVIIRVLSIKRSELSLWNGDERGKCLRRDGESPAAVRGLNGTKDERCKLALGLCTRGLLDPICLRPPRPANGQGCTLPLYVPVVYKFATTLRPFFFISFMMAASGRPFRQYIQHYLTAGASEKQVVCTRRRAFVA